MLLYMYPVAHSCSYSGCGRVLVLDGNMKNHRDICLARSAGIVEFKNLPGQITTGCINTPAYKSRYCVDHTPSTSESGSSTKAIITGKKCTRTGIYYQVILLLSMYCYAYSSCIHSSSIYTHNNYLT